MATLKQNTISIGTLFAACFGILVQTAQGFDRSAVSSAPTVRRLASQKAFKHTCAFQSLDQYYNIHSVKLEKVVKGTSPEFPVSLHRHEQSTVKLTNDLGEETLFTILTGTLVDPADGPVISASAHFKHLEREESIALIMDVRSPMARTSRYFQFEKDAKYHLLSITLKCTGMQPQTSLD